MTKFCKKCNCETERRANGQCKPCDKLNSSTYRAAHPDRKKATTAAYYAANKERVLAANTAWYAANREAASATKATWNKANRESRRIHEQNREARKRDGGKLSQDLSSRLFNLQKGKCPCCKQPLGDDYHLDHIIPLALGGSNTDDNIQLLRQRCNNQKHAKHPVEFMQSKGFLL